MSFGDDDTSKTYTTATAGSGFTNFMTRTMSQFNRVFGEGSQQSKLMQARIDKPSSLIGERAPPTADSGSGRKSLLGQ